MKKNALTSLTMHQVPDQNLSAYAVNVGGVFLDKAYSKEQVLLTPIYYIPCRLLYAEDGFFCYTL